MSKGAKAKRAMFIVISDNSGGAERVTFGLASELASRPGWRVEVKIASSKLPNSFSERALSSNVQVNYGFVRNWFFAFPMLPFRLLFRRYDLIFTTHPYTTALLSIMRRFGLIRVERLLAREATSPFDSFSSERRQRLLKRLYSSYGGEDLLIAQTSFMAEHIRLSLPTRSAAHLKVMGNPVDVDAARAGADAAAELELAGQLSAAPKVLFCGKLVDIKQPLLALSVFEQLIADGCSLQLIFAGDGPLQMQLREEANQRGLAGSVLFLGECPNPYAVMHACQYGLVTSRREGFPNVVLEMMACGVRKIVITPCAGDLDQLPGVTVTQTFEAEEIAKALRDAIETGEDASDRYIAYAETRTVRAYVDDLLRLVCLPSSAPQAT